jgi:hypothetical protein
MQEEEGVDGFELDTSGHEAVSEDREVDGVEEEKDERGYGFCFEH